MTKVVIVYYSMYGHIATMANAVKKGVEAGGASVEIFQVPVTLSEEVLTNSRLSSSRPISFLGAIS
jgi:NAD(P)H dehydrogenase (quinone)